MNCSYDDVRVNIKLKEYLVTFCFVFSAPREQLNQITSYLDASMVYGSTVEEAQTLQDTSRPGMLSASATHNLHTYPLSMNLLSIFNKALSTRPMKS